MSLAAEAPVVPDDATLDAFVRENGDGGETADAPDPAAVTSSWWGASTCESCGKPVGRRWLDDGERVCAACKRWS